MRDILRQGRPVWRYAAVKNVGAVFDALAVITAATWGIYAGFSVLVARIGIGLLTDLTFFRALVLTNGGAPK